MSPGLVPVVTFTDGDRPDLEEQVPLPGHPGGESPGAVSACWPGLPVGGKGERWPAGRVRSPRPARRAGCAGCAGLSPGAVAAAAGGCGPGAAVPDGVAVLVAATHQVERGLRAAAAARSRARSGSMGPRPASSPGRSARPSRVAAGMVKVTRPANPGGITPATGPPGAGVRGWPVSSFPSASGRESVPSSRSRKALARSWSMSPSSPGEEQYDGEVGLHAVWGLSPLAALAG